jgi:hypothetical protein
LRGRILAVSRAAAVAVSRCADAAHGTIPSRAVETRSAWRAIRGIGVVEW